MVKLGIDVIDDEIRAVFAQIHDPCSVAAGRTISLLDMGLVRGWTLEDQILSVTFCVTFAGCTMAPHFMEAAARDLAMIAGVERVETKVDTKFVWTPDRMATGHIHMTGQPQAWRTRVTP
jgi:metal-sulfur cluster biosynthetic enzyme